MTAGDSNGGKLRSEHQSSVARDDWQRYGLSHRGGAVEAPRDALGRPVGPADHREAPDDLFLQYRREATQRLQRTHPPDRSPRFMANLATIGVIVALGAGLIVFGAVTSPSTPLVSPSPSRFASPTINASSFPIAEGSAGPRTAHVNLLIDLPVSVAVTERDRPVDDGTTMYLTGSVGGVAINEIRGTIGTVYGGPAFAGGVRRAVVDGGIWVSSWPASAKSCGPTCWAQATTYRIDVTTGTVSKTLAATYLLGAADDGVWVATGKVVESLDPDTGVVLSSLTWGRTSEPRVGCGALWSFDPGAQESTLFQIDAKSGMVLGASSLDPAVTYGPVSVKDQCWMMNGSGGATSGATTLVWLNSDGTVQATFDYPGLSVVVIDGEFWLYGSGGQLQRVEATSGIGFGASYVLSVPPPNDDPTWLFSASHALWMISGASLVSFGVPTGAANAAG
jgi:hypothetical protein